MLMIFKSEVISVNEKALFVKQVLLTINGLLLSGNLTTFETNDESVIPDKWAPRYFELGEEDSIIIFEFSLFTISTKACAYFFDEKSTKSELLILIILSAP